MDLLKDLLAALSVILNGLPQGLLALSFGFASVPTAFAFIVGAVGCLALGVVAPVSFQAETITLAGTMGKNMRERISMVILGGVGMTIIGAFGLLERIVGYGSIAISFITYMFTKDLVYTISISVIGTSIVAMALKQKSDINITEREKIVFQKPIVNIDVIRGALAMICLNIGANIAFGEITGSIANIDVNIDHLSIVSSLADLASAMFGGGPVESIISATGGAPHPIMSGVLMMSLMAIILFAGLLPKMAKYIPSESIAGFLFVLGAIVTVPVNAMAALSVTGVTRELPIIQINDNLSIASFVILGDTELVCAAAPEIVKRLPEIDVLVTAEAKGIPLVFEISRLLNMKNYIVARKSVKPYMSSPIIDEVVSITTQKKQLLCLEEKDVECIRGKRVAIIDDVISTGESIQALERLVELAGGIISAKAAILAEGEAANREDIIFLEYLPLFE